MTPPNAIVYGTCLVPLQPAAVAGRAIVTVWAGLTIFTPILPR